MPEAAPSIRVGTCGWSCKDWVGPFYPNGLAPADYLSYYAEHFPIVEVDSSFYRSPSETMVQGWRKKTPEGFAFALKVPQTITHEKVLVDCSGEVEEFASAARLLGDKLLCCALQFGYFNRARFARPEPFLQLLDSFLGAWPKDITVAVEIRNKDWLSEAFAGCLRRHDAVWVLTDQAWMLPPLKVVERSTW